MPIREESWNLLCEWTEGDNDLWGGAEELGLSFDEHCAFLIAALREIQGELGLKSAVA